MLAGCAFLQISTALDTQGYTGEWIKIDPAQVTAPSGAHLYNLLVNGSAVIKSLDSEYGTPNYVKAVEKGRGHRGLGNSEVMLVYLARNLFVVADWIYGDKTTRALDQISRGTMPHDLFLICQRQVEDRKRQTEELRRQGIERQRQKEEILRNEHFKAVVNEIVSGEGKHDEQVGSSSVSNANFKIVEAVGIGLTQDEAQKNALYLAVEQVVGALVDAKTQIENDKIVKDQILTMSAGYVEDYSVVGSPVQKDGKFEITISAKVKRTRLLCDLADKNVAMKGDVKGDALWGQAVTQGRVKDQADKIIEALLSYDPRKFCVERLSADELIHPSELTEEHLKKGDNWMRMNLKLYVDNNEYNVIFLPKMIRCLESIAKGVSISTPFRVDSESNDYLNRNFSPAKFSYYTGGIIKLDRSKSVPKESVSGKGKLLRIYKLPSAVSGGQDESIEELIYDLPPFYGRIFASKIGANETRKVILIEFLDENQAVVADYRIKMNLDAFLSASELDGEYKICPELRAHDNLSLLSYINMNVTFPVKQDVLKKMKSTRITVNECDEMLPAWLKHYM
jgi:hypothetical protein